MPQSQCRPASAATLDVGVDIIGAPSCFGVEGSGCISDRCRFCQLYPTEFSKSYLPCTLPIPLPEPLPVVVANPSPTANLPTKVASPGPTVQSPPEMVSRPPETPALVDGGDLGWIDCTAEVEEEAVAAGIWAVTDSSCAEDVEAFDCMNELCRLCYTVKTDTSSPYSSCDDFPSKAAV